MTGNTSPLVLAYCFPLLSKMFCIFVAGWIVLYVVKANISPWSCSTVPVTSSFCRVWSLHVNSRMSTICMQGWFHCRGERRPDALIGAGVARQQMSSQRGDVLPVEEGGRGGAEAEWKKNKKEVENAAGGGGRGGWLSHDKQPQQQTGHDLLCEFEWNFIPMMKQESITFAYTVYFAKSSTCEPNYCS